MSSFRLRAKLALDYEQFRVFQKFQIIYIFNSILMLSLYTYIFTYMINLILYRWTQSEVKRRQRSWLTSSCTQKYQITNHQPIMLSYLRKVTHEKSFYLYACQFPDTSNILITLECMEISVNNFLLYLSLIHLRGDSCYQNRFMSSQRV